MNDDFIADRSCYTVNYYPFQLALGKKEKEESNWAIENIRETWKLKTEMPNFDCKLGPKVSEHLANSPKVGVILPPLRQVEKLMMTTI